MSRIGEVISITLVVVTAYSLTSCGSGLPHSDQISARITPVQATVASGGSLVLQARTSGFTNPTLFYKWGVSEANYAQGDDCGYLSAPPTFPCDCGYVIYAISQNSATYYAMSPGTYHVTLETTQYAEFDWVTAKATATITVIP